MVLREKLQRSNGSWRLRQGIAAVMIGFIVVLLALSRGTSGLPAKRAELRVQHPPASDVAAAIVRDSPAASPRSFAPAVLSTVAVNSDSVRPSANGALVSGTVQDASGGPIAGALVSVRAEAGAEGAPASTLSDERGQFRLTLPVGWAQIEASADAYSRGVTRVHAPAAGVAIQLAPPAMISGRVVSGDEVTPLAGALVLARCAAGQCAGEISTLTEADGSFSFQQLCAGTYELESIGKLFRTPRVSVVVDVAVASEPLLLVAKAASSLTGIVNVSGGECRDGSVELSGPVPTSKSLSNGAVEFDGLLPGSYRAMLECPWIGAELSDDVEIGADPITRVWQVDAGLTLDGRVQGPSGAPQEGVTVQLEPIGAPEDRPWRTCVSDALGNFSCVGLAAGDYLAQPMIDGATTPGEAVRVSLTAAGAPPVTLISAGMATIRVRVEPGSANGPAGFTAIARPASGPPVYGQPDADSSVLAGLALGEYVVSLGDATDASSSARVLLERDGEVRELTLVPPRGAPISGHVVDERGEPIVDAWVRVAASVPDTLLGLQPVAPVLTDDRGAFVLPELLPGSYRLTASNEMGEAALDGASPGATALELRLARAASLSGTVTGPFGEPLQDVGVRCSDDARGESRTAQVFDGKWSIFRLPPGRYRLDAWSGAAVGSQEVVVTSGQSAVINLALRPQQLPAEPSEP